MDIVIFCIFGFMENNLKFNTIPITHFFTQDEWNNFLIDSWVANQKVINSDISAIGGPTVTITLTKANYSPYFDDIDLG